MIETIKKTVLAGIGAAAVTTEKAEKALNELVEKGKLSANDAKEAAKKIADEGKGDGADFSYGQRFLENDGSQQQGEYHRSLVEHGGTDLAVLHPGDDAVALPVVQPAGHRFLQAAGLVIDRPRAVLADEFGDAAEDVATRRE